MPLVSHTILPPKPHPADPLSGPIPWDRVTARQFTAGDPVNVVWMFLHRSDIAMVPETLTVWVDSRIDHNTGIRHGMTRGARRHPVPLIYRRGLVREYWLTQPEGSINAKLNSPPAAGPFPTLRAAKAAYRLLTGINN